MTTTDYLNELLNNTATYSFTFTGDKMVEKISQFRNTSDNTGSPFFFWQYAGKNPIVEGKITCTSGCAVAYAYSDRCGKGNHEADIKKEFSPIRIIYNPPHTICYFPDGDKTVAGCSEGEVFSKETGVMACIIKKIFKNRAEFLRLVNSGYEQPPKEKK